MIMRVVKGTFKSMAVRFNRYVDKTGDCWVWAGARTRYGQLTIGSSVLGTKRSVKAHRVAYALHNGSIDPRLLVCHTCDVELCVLPEHLYQSTHKDNADDRQSRGRWRGGGYPGMNNGITKSVATRAKMSEAMRRRWADPVARARLIEAKKAAFF